MANWEPAELERGAGTRHQSGEGRGSERPLTAGQDRPSPYLMNHTVFTARVCVSQAFISTLALPSCFFHLFFFCGLYTLGICTVASLNNSSTKVQTPKPSWLGDIVQLSLMRRSFTLLKLFGSEVNRSTSTCGKKDNLVHPEPGKVGTR